MERHTMGHQLGKSTPPSNDQPGHIRLTQHDQEFFDPNFRSIAQAFTTASNWLFNFLVSRFTEQMFAAMGYGVYFFFATLSFFAFFYAFFLIPETSGIPLEKMERLFEIKPIWKANETLKEELAREEQRFRTDVKGRVDHKENGGSGGSESEDGSP